MSKLRSLSTSFWSDPFVEDLSVSEKLLFIYLITNEKTNMLGIYEMSIKKISFETGIDKVTIQKALKRFESLNKVKYIDNHVVLVNFLKHQNFNTNMKKSAIDCYMNLPESIKIQGLTIDKSNPLKAFESLCKGFGMVRKIEVEDELELEDENKKNIEERKTEFINSLHPFLDVYSNQLLKDFAEYWTEHGEKDKKMRFEKEKSFSIDRRLKTWKRNESKFGTDKINIGNYDENRYKGISFDGY